MDFNTKGIIKRDKDGNLVIPCRPLYNVLGDEGILLFKEIFDNSLTQPLYSAFINDPFTRKMWKFIDDNLTIEHIFGKEENIN